MMLSFGAHDQALGPVEGFVRHGEGHAHGVEQAEQQEGRDHRQQGQRGARLLAEQAGPDELEIFHGDVPVGIQAVAAASFTSVPLSRCSWRRAYSAALGSWVTMTMVLPCSRLRVCSRRRISSAVWRSRSPVGLVAHQQLGDRRRWRGRWPRAAPGRRTAPWACGARARPAPPAAGRFPRCACAAAAESEVSSSGSSRSSAPTAWAAGCRTGTRSRRWLSATWPARRRSSGRCVGRRR